MSGHAMVAVLWAAALYRVVLSIRSPRRVWRTAFTICIVGVALGATSSVFGDQSVDAWSAVWNLALLVTRLALTSAAVAASIYVVTLQREIVPRHVLPGRLTGGTVLAVTQIVAWAAAPIHDRELATTAEVNESSTAGCIFALAFTVAITLATAHVALFCIANAASRIDATRTISLLLTGAACVAGATLFSLVGVGVLLHQLTGSDSTAISQVMDRVVPLVAVVLALGTLSLLVAPPLVDLIHSYLRWRTLRPLWVHLVGLRPDVHLDLPRTGGPLDRLHLRLHRSIVEIHDALRVTPVCVPAEADANELAAALHRVGGERMAGEVLAAQAGSADADDTEQLLALARRWARGRA